MPVPRNSLSERIGRSNLDAGLPAWPEGLFIQESHVVLRASNSFRSADFAALAFGVVGMIDLFPRLSEKVVHRAAHLVCAGLCDLLG